MTPPGSDYPQAESLSSDCFPAATKPDMAAMSCYSDHMYGSDPSQFVRVRRPASSGPARVVYVVHGGFWKAKYGLNTVAGTACESVAPDLVRRGFAAIEVEYRRGSAFLFPAPDEDVVAAVAFVDKRLKKHYRLCDAADSALLGFSAGGQLVLGAVLALAPSLQPGKVVAVAPVADLHLAAQLRLSDDGDAVQTYLGGESNDKEVQYMRACPTCRAEELARYAGSIAIVAGTCDDDVPLRVVDSLRERLIRFRNETTAGDIVDLKLVNVPEANHYDLMNAQHPQWETIAALLSPSSSAQTPAVTRSSLRLAVQYIE